MSRRHRTRRNGFTLYKQPRSSYWSADIHIGGKRVRRSTRERDRRAAQAKAQQLFDELVAEQGRPGRMEGDDLALLAGFDIAEAQARGVGQRQLESIEACWGHVCRTLGTDLDPAEVTYERVVGYLASRRAEGARGQSIVKEVQALKRGLKVAKRRGSIRAMPDEWPVVRRDPPNKRQRGKLHPAELIGRWLEHLSDVAPVASRQAAVAVHTGLRATELRLLTWDWVESAPEGSGVSAMLRVPAEAAKTKQERVIGLTDEALAAIEQARALAQAWDAPLFPGNHRKAFKAAAEALQYGKTITLRDLRHCHATWAAQGTGDAAAAQAALGHNDLRTTQRYLSATLARTASAAVAVSAHLEATRDARLHGMPTNRHTKPSYPKASPRERGDPEGRKAAPGRHSSQVGVRGFEPPASCSRSRRATRLRHTPTFNRMPLR